MNAFSRRYFVWISLILLAFSGISLKMNGIIIFTIFALVAAFFYLFLQKNAKDRKNLKTLTLLFLVAAFVGTCASNVLLFKNEKLVQKYSGVHSVCGYVIEDRQRESFYSEHIVHVESLNDERVDFDIVLAANYQTEIYKGDFIKCELELFPTESYSDTDFSMADNTYDYPLVSSITEETEIEYCAREFRTRLALTEFNSKLSLRLQTVLGKKTGSLASALLLGNRELLSSELLRDFKRAGVYHMLALSGLHVAILIGIFEIILKKCGLPLAPRAITLTLLSLFYIALTGFALSACRSMLMLFVMYLSFVLGRVKDSMTSLFAAICVIVLVSPSAIFDIGLQLSFLSTFGVICASIIKNGLAFLKPSGKMKTVRDFIKHGYLHIIYLLIASVCVSVATLPVLTLNFGEISLATVFSNLFMGLFCELFMILSLVSLLVSPLPHFCSLLSALSSAVGELMLRIVQKIADSEDIMLSLSYKGTWALVGFLFVMSVTLLSLDLKKKWLICVPSIIFCVLFCMNIVLFNVQRSDAVSVQFIVGDALVLNSSDEVYIVDSSNGNYSELYEAMQLSKNECFTELDGVVLTHYHSTHPRALEKLCSRYKVRSVFVPIPQDADEDIVMRSIVRVLEDKSVKTYLYDPNTPLEMLSGTLVVSERAFGENGTHPSVALSFSYKDMRLTLLERPFFESQLDKLGAFDSFIEESDYLIYGSHGRAPKESFELFSRLLPSCEVSFYSFSDLELSDFEKHIENMRIFFNVDYKKIELK